MHKAHDIPSSTNGEMMKCSYKVKARVFLNKFIFCCKNIDLELPLTVYQQELGNRKIVNKFFTPSDWNPTIFEEKKCSITDALPTIITKPDTN